MSENLPNFIDRIDGELPDNYWQPKNLQEWLEMKKTETTLSTWKEQQDQERDLRKTISKVIFTIISCQLVAIFFLVTADSLSWIKINENILQILFPSAVFEVFGMGFIVVKYLFSKPSKTILDFLTNQPK